MRYDFVLRFKSSEERASFTVEAVNMEDAEEVLVRRMLAAGWSLRSLLHWHVVAVVELGRRG